MYISLSDRPAPEPEKGPENEPENGPENAPAAAQSRRRAAVAPTVIALGIVSLLTDISSESTAAVLPLYITAALGLSTIAYGFLDGLSQGISAVVRIGAGWTADRTARPKAIAGAGYGLSLLARIGLLLSAGPGAALGPAAASATATVSAVVAVDRIGKGIRTAPRDALIAAASEPNALARAFGVHRMLDTIGATIGPLLAFIVLLLVPDGYRTVFVVSAAFAALGVIVLLLFVPGAARSTRATRSARAVRRRTPRARLPWRDLLAPRMRRLLLAAGVLGLLTVGDGFVYLVLQSRDAFATTWFPLLYVGTNAAYLALAVPFGRLADRWGRVRLFLAGHVALLAVYLVAAGAPSGLWSTLLCLALLGAFYAATDGVLAAIAGTAVSTALRSSGIAAAQTVVAVARLLASVGFGVLWYAWGREAAMITVAAALVVGLVTAAALLRERRIGAPSLRRKPVRRGPE
ncbi:MFS transporter [Microbacteriaceae bacterium VKM Ac-2854]|nr:MFS transporter [Microbacteriaceae bacterium VKM Ac-2854]